MWEVFTLGCSPYPGLPTEDLYAYLEGGKRMECPQECPKELYSIILDCWARNPYSRPTFRELTERITNCMEQNVNEVSMF